MTADDLKRLDKRIRQIQDPFGTGFQLQRKLWLDCAKTNGITICEVRRQYDSWKRKR
ncbi:MAG: hypothetical protein LKJ17_02800 [Oscillospiraceae bacterium]|jgi:hypothetical protein|nr:hypothetical protein [Oscillospiraceae bacterium]